MSPAIRCTPERAGLSRNTHETPPEILKKTLETWDAIAKEEAAKKTFFAKVLESQRAYASGVVPGRAR